MAKTFWVVFPIRWIITASFKTRFVKYVTASTKFLTCYCSLIVFACKISIQKWIHQDSGAFIHIDLRFHFEFWSKLWNMMWYLLISDLSVLSVFWRENLNIPNYTWNIRKARYLKKQKCLRKISAQYTRAFEHSYPS